MPLHLWRGGGSSGSRQASPRLVLGYCASSIISATAPDLASFPSIYLCVVKDQSHYWAWPHSLWHHGLNQAARGAMPGSARPSQAEPHLRQGLARSGEEAPATAVRLGVGRATPGRARVSIGLLCMLNIFRHRARPCQAFPLSIMCCGPPGMEDLGPGGGARGILLVIGKAERSCATAPDSASARLCQ